MENEDRGCKREREESADGCPEVKRIRDELILEILEDDDEGVESGDDRIPVEVGLEEFMKSFGDEIGVTTVEHKSSGKGKEGESGDGSDELGFLLEASDYELGLPPTVTSSPLEEEEVGISEVGVSSDGDGFDPIWGFEDEISSFYDGFNPVVVQTDDDNNGNDVLVFEDGLFDSDLMSSWPSDYSDLFCRPESSPPV